MLPHSDHRRRQDLHAGSNQQPSSDQLEYVTWASLLIKSNQGSFGRPDAGTKFGPWARRSLPRPAGDDELRSTTPPAIAEALPDNSRAEMIERCRKEMMELVRSMPVEEGEEFAQFELSLRDIVVSPSSMEPETEPAAEAALVGSETEGGLIKKKKQTNISKKVRRCNSGLILIRAIMPSLHALLAGHRRIAGAGAGKGAKISPKPHRTGYQGRSSSDESSGSSDDGGRRIKGRMGSCCSFLQRNGGRIMEI